MVWYGMVCLLDWIGLLSGAMRPPSFLPWIQLSEN
jgi:hypothetical protein